MVHPLLRGFSDAALLLLLTTAACKREPDQGTSGTTSGVSGPAAQERSAVASKPTTKRAIGEACTNAFDCVEGPGCTVACEETLAAGSRSAGKTCQLRSTSGVGGVENCIGNASGGELTSFPNVGFARAVYCDQTKGAFCDESTYRCTPVKRLGEACGTHDGECGADGACKDGTCKAASPVGGRCNPGKCSSAGFCNMQKSICEAKRPLGARCDVYNECASAFCTRSAGCAAAESPALCKL